MDSYLSIWFSSKLHVVIGSSCAQNSKFFLRTQRRLRKSTYKPQIIATKDSFLDIFKHLRNLYLFISIASLLKKNRFHDRQCELNNIKKKIAHLNFIYNFTFIISSWSAEGILSWHIPSLNFPLTRQNSIHFSQYDFDLNLML